MNLSENIKLFQHNCAAIAHYIQYKQTLGLGSPIFLSTYKIAFPDSFLCFKFNILFDMVSTLKFVIT